MSLLGKLKSLFGKDTPDTDEPRDTSVTVEREPGDTTAGTDTESPATTSDTPSTESPGSSDGHATDEPADEDAETADSEPEDLGDETADEEGDTDESTGAAEPVEAAADTDPEPTGTPVDKIKGVGPTYADRLGEAGIDTIGQLAEADPAALADETDIAESRVENWVEQAKARSK